MACWAGGGYPSCSNAYPYTWHHPLYYPNYYAPGLYGSWGGYPCWSGCAPTGAFYGGCSYSLWYGAAGGSCCS